MPKLSGLTDEPAQTFTRVPPPVASDGRKLARPRQGHAWHDAQDVLRIRACEVRATADG
jgi:hypothetical protein